MARTKQTALKRISSKKPIIRYAYAQPVIRPTSTVMNLIPGARAMIEIITKKLADAKKSVAVKSKSAVKTKPESAKSVPKTTKKVISKAPKPVYTAQEKLRLKEERELLKAERLRIREEKARVKAEKDQIKQEKLRMWELNPTKNIPEIKTNPFCTAVKGTTRNLPGKGCCIFCNNRESLQCVHWKDVKGLKQSFDDINNISNPFQQFGIDCGDNILKQIVKSENFELFKLVIDQQIKERNSDTCKRVKLPQVALTKAGTGFQNKFSHNFPMRQVKLSRGGKDGNNAFTYDGKIRKRLNIDPTDVLKLIPPPSFIKYMLDTKQSTSKTGPIMFKQEPQPFLNKRQLANFWIKATRKGDYNMVRMILQFNEKEHHLYLAKLHQNAILQGKEAEAVKILKRNSLLKQSSEHDQNYLMPAHIACINPDPTILQVFFRMYPTSLQNDSKGRDLIHYAVMNRNPDVLEFLISKRQIVNNTDNDGTTPLMLACKYGKAKAVELLLEDQEKQKQLLDPNDKDFSHYESFYSYVKTVGSYQNTPLHYAMRSGSLAIVKALVEAGAPLDVKNFYNDTPLSVACQRGHLGIADYLLKQGANIHGVDKQQRSPLIRACQNGQIHIASMLLRRGVNVNFCDLSQNTALHHACAYGWLDIVKLLVEHGKADVNRLNEWKSSPTIIAMLKGHFGIVDYLLAGKDVDASMVDDDGRSLVSQLCLNLNEDSVKNLKFLLQKKKINVQQKTTDGFSPLHILACNDVAAIAKEVIVEKGEPAEQKPQYFMRRGKRIRRHVHIYNRYQPYSQLFRFVFSEHRKEYNQLFEKLKDTQIKCAELLIKAGCKVGDLTSSNTGECSPVCLAIQGHNYDLATFLLSKSDQISGKDKQNNNILHMMSNNFIHFPEASKFLTQLIKVKKTDCKRLAQEENDQGYTPFNAYFVVAKDQLTGSWLNQCMNDFDNCPNKYVRQTLFPSAITHLKQVIQLFVNQLGQDVTLRYGMAKHRMDRATQQLQEGGMTQETYDKLVSLTLLDQEYSQQTVDGFKSSKSKNTEQFNQYGYVTDTSKEQMGLMQVQEEEEKSNFNPFGFGGKRTARRKVARRSNNPFWMNNNQQDVESEDDDESKEEKERQTLNESYYGHWGTLTLQNVVHQVLQVIEYFKRFNDNMASVNSEQYQDLIIDLLKISKQRIAQNKKKGLQGFNKSDRHGKTVMVEVLEKSLFDLACKMVKADTLDLTVQQYKTGMSPVHIISANITSNDVLSTILGSIDKKQLFIKDKNGNTPLHYAAYKRNIVMCQLLCDNAKADVNVTNKFGFSPLHMSLFSFNEKKDHTPAFEKYLLQKGANPNALDLDKRSPLFYLFFKHKQPEAEQSSDPASILMAILKTDILKKKDYAQRDRTNNTILHYACMVGATICTLTLINYGFDPKAVNLIGNSPYAMALAHGQQQICTFLIQSGCSSNEMVTYLKSKTGKTSREQLKKLVIPKQLYEKLFESDTNVKLSDTDKISKDYSKSHYTPFYQAMQKGWGGVGYLLFSKNIDPFQALSGCLQSHKYENFLDLLDNVPVSVAKQVDGKGRNLLLILLRFLGESSFGQGSQELKRALEVVDYLTSTKKQKDNGMLGKQSPGLSMMSTDQRGYNALHAISARGNMIIFEEVINKLTKADAITLLKQKATVNNQNRGSPLPYLFTKLQEETAPDFVKLLFVVHNKIGANDFKSIPFEYFPREDAVSTEVPSYLNFDNPLMSDNSASTQLSHMVKSLLCDSKYLSIYPVKELDRLFTLMRPFFTYQDQQGQTMLMKLVQNNSIPIFRSYLLGASYVIDKNNPQNGEYQMFVNSKPRVNLNVQDKIGRTALHYAIEPCAKFAGKGFRLDATAIESLVKAGASTAIKDEKGISPLDLAKQNENILNIVKPKDLVLLGNKDNLISKIANQSFIQIGVRPYTAEADRFLAQQIDQIKAGQMIIDDAANKPEVAVDKHDDLMNCEVVQSDVLAKDGVSKLFYDVVMIKIDVKAGYYGVNVFYVIQLLHDKAKDLYLLWTRWGRIGEVFGQYQRTPFPTLMAAQMEFEKVFRQKSGNKWADINAFVRVPKRYILRQISGKTVFMTPDMKEWKTTETKVDMSKVFVNFSEQLNLKKSNLTSDELAFMQPLVNSAAILRKFKEQSYSDNLFAECLLDRKVLQSLIKILQELVETQVTMEYYQGQRQHDAYVIAFEHKFELMNQYYELTTPTEFAFSKMKNFYNQYNIYEEIKHLISLRDLEQASQLLLAAAYNMKSISPYDFCFKNMNCKLNVVSPNSDTYQLLLRYINASHGDHHKKMILQNIFEVGSKSGQTDPHLFSETHNHMMLFHGTNNANLISILEQGLQMKPRNAAFYHGSAQGEGIYFADQFKLAMNYSDNESTDDFFVLVCEVALGNVMNSIQQYNQNASGYFCSDTDSVKGYHSVRVMSQKGPDFDQNWVQKGSNAIWPLGNVVQYEPPFFKFKTEECTKMHSIMNVLDPQRKNEALHEMVIDAVSLKPIKKMVNTIVPNEIHHFDQVRGYGGRLSYHEHNMFNVGLQEAQYIVANPDQVKVKYILQIKNKK